MQKPEILIYESADGATIEVSVDQDTVWLDQYQLADLFQTDRTSILRHIKNIYTSGELAAAETSVERAQQQQEGKRKITRQITRYNLDLIISVGYRVNSRTAISESLRSCSCGSWRRMGCCIIRMGRESSRTTRWWP